MPPTASSRQVLPVGPGLEIIKSHQGDLVIRIRKSLKNNLAKKKCLLGSKGKRISNGRHMLASEQRTSKR